MIFIYINNAGYSNPDLCQNDANIFNTIDINFLSPVFICQLALQNKCKHIVNIASVASFVSGTWINRNKK